MYEKGPSLSPGALSPEHSRGHPLLFYFLGSTWMKIFGATRVSLHWFALTISASLIILTYVIGFRVGSPITGFFSALLLTINEPFLAQSGLYLPEILLALLTLLTIQSYIDKRKIYVIIYGTLALLTKESAIVIIFTLLVWQLTRSIIYRIDSLKSTVIWASVIITPVIALSFHFIYQKFIYDWFFFPEHMALMSFDVNDIIYKMKLSFLELFERQGIEWYMYSFALIASLLFHPYQRPWYRILIPLLYIASIKVLFGRWTLPVIPTLIITIACFTSLWILKYLPLFRLDSRKGEFLNVSYLFTTGFLIFSSLNFYTDRYLLSIVPVFILGFAVYIEWALTNYHRYIIPSLLIFLSTIQFILIRNDNKIGDTRLSYIDAIYVQHSLIQECEERELYGEAIVATFIEEFYMRNPMAGYLSSFNTFTNISTSLKDDTRYVIFTNASPNALLEKRDTLNHPLIKRVEKGVVWGEIHERIPN